MGRRAQFIAAALAAAVVLASCHSGGESGLVERSSEHPSPLEQAEERVDAFSDGLDAAIRARAAAMPAPTLAEALAADGVVAHLEPRYAELVQRLYTERDFQPLFLVDGRMTPVGAAVLATLQDSWAHGLWPLEYGAETAQDALEHIEHLRQVGGSERITLAAGERATLAESVARRPDLLEREGEPLVIPILDLILNPVDGEPSAAPNVADAYNRLVDADRAAAAQAVQAELALAAGFLRYAWDLRFFNAAWFPREVAADSALLELAQHEAMGNAFRALEDAPNEVLAALPPPYEQYTRLVDAHRRYRAFAEAGGWRTDLETSEMRAGDVDEMVVRLRERLAAEGYFEGDLTSDVYDSEIREALRQYQRTHQFEDDAELSRGEVDSLNTSALERAQQIVINLQRWRESQITEAATFILVNVPDFHVEVWRDLHRDLRFRIIVGATTRVRNRQTGEYSYIRATPEVHEPLRYVVFNPYWNVPQGIMLEEYDPNLVENPFWYEENGYEVLYNERGIRWVRMLPGPRNALGVVKFLFPNEHDVYLHDTPTRNLFNRAQRTFSHGCMRVENPMELAYYLLEHDRGWTRERVDQERGVLGNGELPNPIPLDEYDHWLSLRTPIPVHVEYYVVRVDDEGWTHFNGDIYRRNVELMEQRARREADEAARLAARQIHSGLGTVLRRLESGGAQPEAGRDANDAAVVNDDPTQRLAAD